jgi:hypothetical protein
MILNEDLTFSTSYKNSRRTAHDKHFDEAQGTS